MSAGLLAVTKNPLLSIIDTAMIATVDSTDESGKPISLYVVLDLNLAFDTGYGLSEEQRLKLLAKGRSDECKSRTTKRH